MSAVGIRARLISQCYRGRRGDPGRDGEEGAGATGQQAARLEIVHYGANAAVLGHCHDLAERCALPTRLGNEARAQAMRGPIAVPPGEGRATLHHPRDMVGEGGSLARCSPRCRRTRKPRRRPA